MSCMGIFCRPHERVLRVNITSKMEALLIWEKSRVTCEGHPPPLQATTRSNDDVFHTPVVTTAE
jgi:hypothetical protein